MNISRRQFFRLAPASVGAIALGATVATKSDDMTWADFERITRPIDTEKMLDTMTLAAQKAVDPPIMATFEFDATQIYYIQPSRKSRRVFGFRPV